MSTVQDIIAKVVSGEDPCIVLTGAIEEVYTQNFGGKTKPHSVWDKVPEAERPFDWSTPAPDFRGAQPLSWRVAHKDKAQKLLKDTFGHQYPDIYADFWQDVGGKRALWVGVRDNRTRDRLEQLAKDIKAKGWPVKFHATTQGAIYLLDDLPSHPLSEQQSEVAAQMPGSARMETDETPDEKAGGALGSYYLQLKREGWKAIKAPRPGLKMTDCEALGKLNGEKVKRLLDKGIVLAKDTKDGLAR